MSAGGIRNNSGIRVQIDQERSRQTPKTDFGSVMKSGMAKTGTAVMQAGALAAPFVPGGAVVSAAISGMGALKSTAGASTSSGGGGNSTTVGLPGSTASGSGVVGGTTNASYGGYTDAVAAQAAGGDSQAQMMMATREMQEMNMSFNLQYLQLQQKMQGENRRFTTLSNIMKVKHDTAKNAINNVR